MQRFEKRNWWFLAPALSLDWCRWFLNQRICMLWMLTKLLKYQRHHHHHHRYFLTNKASLCHNWLIYYLQLVCTALHDSIILLMNYFLNFIPGTRNILINHMRPSWYMNVSNTLRFIPILVLLSIIKHWLPNQHYITDVSTNAQV